MKNCMLRVVKNEYCQKGFTLVELLVSISVFAMVMIAFVGLFISAIKQQRQTLRFNSLLNTASYVAEYMDRALRMAIKDRTGDCIGAANKNFSVGVGSIRFLNYEMKCQEFYQDNSQIKVKKSPNATSASLPALGDALTPANIVVGPLNFLVSGDGQGDDLQPKITVNALISTTDTPPQKLRFQTTVSQRELDVVRP